MMAVMETTMATTVPVRVAGELVIKLDEIPEMALAAVKGALTIENEEKAKAAELRRHGWWDMADTISLWREEVRRGGDKVICLPRGFAMALESGLAGMGLTVVWDDQRTKSPAADGYFRQFVLRSYQLEAVIDILKYGQGVYRAPAGCVVGDTELRFNRAGKGFRRDIADAYKRFHGLKGSKSWDRSIPTFCRALVDGIYRQHLVEDIIYSGPKPVIEIELESGKKICCTREHGILTKQGWKSAGQIDVGSMVTVNGEPVRVLECSDCGESVPLPKPRRFPSSYQPKYPGLCPSCRGRAVTAKITMQVIKDKDGYLQERALGHPRANSHNRVYQHILVAEAVLGRPVTRDEHVHHKNERGDDNWPDNLEVVTPARHHQLHRGFLKMDGGTTGRGGKIVFIPKYEKIVAVRDAGVQETYDMVMQDPHNNFVANGIVVHNSGKTVTSLGAMAYANQRTLVIVDKAGLVEQWRARAARFFGFPIIRDENGFETAVLTKGAAGAREAGKIGQGVWEERDLTICLRQTLYERAWSMDATKWWAKWGAVWFDECVPPGTMISTPNGPRSIEELEVGDEVLGVDHRTGEVIVTEVKHTMSKATTSDLVSVAGVQMTPNHPVWTLDGYVNAGDLDGEAVVLLHDFHQEGRSTCAGRPDVRAVLETVQGKEGSEVLRSIMRRELLCGQTRQPFQGLDRSSDPSATEEAVAEGAADGRERLLIAAGPIHDLDVLWRSARADGAGREGELEDRRGSRGRDVGDRGGRSFAYLSGAEGAGRAEGLALAVARVDRGPRDEPRGAAELGGGRVQDRGREVFNIETGTGNYFAGGLLTHNCHHLSSETLAEVCRKVTSFYMTGVSATPAKSPAKAKIVHALVGPMIHDTPRQVLYDLGVLMKPTIEVLEGDFFAHFHKDHDATIDNETKHWTCQAHGCKKQGKHKHNNNYSSVLKKLVEDEDRNARIAARIMAEPGHHHLVPSSQLKHLNLIRRALLDAGWPKEKIWLLRGEENAKGLDQQIAQEFARADEGVILSTVAGEALDIPPIDRVHICFPMRDHGATIQIVGRGERVADGKTDSIVIDYREPRTDVFEGQFEERATVYRMQSYVTIQSPYSINMEEVASA